MSTSLTAALVISNRQLWEQAHACIQNLPVRIALEQNEAAEADALLDRIERHRTDVVLMEASKLTLPLEEFIRRLRDTPSQPAVFVLHTEASTDNILEALRAGASEYLYPPMTDTLRDAFLRLSESRTRSSATPAGGLGRVFGFLSAKGGCGATTFVSHVATEVARQLKEPVLLADFDFEAGMLRFIMKTKGAYSVRDALDNMHRMDASYWKALVSKAGKLDVITAPDSLTGRRPAGPRETAHLLRFIRSQYPVTIVDFGRHISSAALDAVPELDLLYVVTTLELDTLDRAKECVAKFSEAGLDEGRVRVLLNRVPERGAADLKGVEAFVGAVAGGSFTDDFIALYDTWSEGRLLDAGTKLGREMNGLASGVVARVRGERNEAAPKAPAEKTAGGGFRKLFARMGRG